MNTMKKIGLSALGVTALICALFLQPITANAAGPAPVGTPLPLPTSTTAPGTLIANSASAAYQDASAGSYTAASNLVNLEVVSVPSIGWDTNNGANTPGSGNIVKGQILTDTFTATNTGNGVGHFQINAATTDPTGGTINKYLVQCPGDASPASYTTRALANTALAAGNCASLNAGDNINIGMNYTVAWTASGTVTPTLAVDLVYAAQNGEGAVTESNVTQSYTDTLVSDARLDLKATATTPVASGGTINYTIDAANGGAMPANYLFALRTSGSNMNGSGFTSTNSGILIAGKLPQFNASPLAITGTPAITKANVGSGTATIVYTTDPAGKTGWNNTSAGALWIGVYISSNTSFPTLNTIPGNAGSTPGNVTNGQAQIELTFSLVAPSGTGSANNPVLEQLNGVVAGNDGNVTNGNNCLIGGGFAPGASCTQNATTSDPSPTYQIAPVNAFGGASGESNTTNTQITSSAGVLTGPKAANAATGSYNGVVATDNTNDFTVLAAGLAGTDGANAPIANGLSIMHDVTNTGNVDDTYTISSTPASGVSVVEYDTVSAGACTATKLSGGSNNQIAVASGATAQYCVKYNVAASPSYGKLNNKVTATALSDGTTNNTTWDVLIPGGFVDVHTTAVVTTPNCPAYVTVSGLQVCPGSIVTYTVTYTNVSPVQGTGVGNIVLATGAGTLVLTEDGAAGSNNWTAYSTGLSTIASDSTTGTTYTGNSLNSTSFTVTVGGATYILVPAGTGSFTFSIKIK